MHRRIVIGARDRKAARLIKSTVERDRRAEARVVTDGFEVLRLSIDHPPDLVILDTNLPHPSGAAVCRMLRARERTARVPIVLISDRSAAADRVRGLGLGADDYVAKPVDWEELRLRVNSILRRSIAALNGPDRFEIDGLVADFSAISVVVNQCAVNLTRREFDLLRCLIQRRNHVLSRDALLEEVWFGDDVTRDTGTVATHVARLRRKLGPAGAHIETLGAQAYRFNG